jgi:GTP cyclohydrolase I
MTKEKPTKEDAQNAIKTIIEYIGDDSSREGVKETPARVLKSYAEIFAGYNADVSSILNKRFHDISGFDDLVMLRSVQFNSVCEHHMLPFSGKVDIAYMSNGFVVGVSKLARLVDAFAKRLQIQEKMTAQIALSLQEYLNPKGVAVRVVATHTCMSVRGVAKDGSVMESVYYTGEFKNNAAKRSEFLSLIKSN